MLVVAAVCVVVVCGGASMAEGRGRGLSRAEQSRGRRGAKAAQSKSTKDGCAERRVLCRCAHPYARYMPSSQWSAAWRIHSGPPLPLPPFPLFCALCRVFEWATRTQLEGRSGLTDPRPINVCHCRPSNCNPLPFRFLLSWPARCLAQASPFRRRGVFCSLVLPVCLSGLLCPRADNERAVYFRSSFLTLLERSEMWRHARGTAIASTSGCPLSKCCCPAWLTVPLV